MQLLPPSLLSVATTGASVAIGSTAAAARAKRAGSGFGIPAL
jgi:hypothetical protein